MRSVRPMFSLYGWPHAAPCATCIGMACVCAYYAWRHPHTRLHHPARAASHSTPAHLFWEGLEAPSANPQQPLAAPHRRLPHSTAPPAPKSIVCTCSSAGRRTGPRRALVGRMIHDTQDTVSLLHLVNLVCTWTPTPKPPFVWSGQVERGMCRVTALARGLTSRHLGIYRLFHSLAPGNRCPHAPSLARSHHRISVTDAARTCQMGGRRPCLFFFWVAWWHRRKNKKDQQPPQIGACHVSRLGVALLCCAPQRGSDAVAMAVHDRRVSLTRVFLLQTGRQCHTRGLCYRDTSWCERKRRLGRGDAIAHIKQRLLALDVRQTSQPPRCPGRSLPNHIPRLLRGISRHIEVFRDAVPQRHPIWPFASPLPASGCPRFH